MTALQERVPYVTDEQRGAAELAEAEHDASYWERLHGSSRHLVDAQTKFVEQSLKRLDDFKAVAANDAEEAETAKAKAVRLANYRGFTI